MVKSIENPNTTEKMCVCVVRDTALTFTNFKVLEGKLRARVIQQHFSIKCEHHGVFVQIHHAAHHVTCLPGTPKVLITLVPALDLEDTHT